MNGNYIPYFYSGKELKEKLETMPEYKTEQRLLPTEQRLLLLDRLYEIYIPNEMSYEIYSKLYIALSRSFNKKFLLDAVRQRNENHKTILGKKSNGLIGGADSILITGTAGIGKSSAIDKAVNLLADDIIETSITRIIPLLIVQCPFDCSVKSLMIAVLKRVDDMLDTDYSTFISAKGQTTDVLIGLVSQVALNHVGVLIIDEIQNVVKSKYGFNLIGALTQLINSSGTSIVMVGTPESKSFFEKEEFFARRAIGMDYSVKKYDNEFLKLIKVMENYIFTKHKSELEEKDYFWIYEHTKGLPSNVITLFHDAQEMAILKGTEVICRETLESAYKDRMGTLHSFIEENVASIVKIKSSRRNNIVYTDSQNETKSFSFEELVKVHKDDILTILEEYVEVTEV